MSKQLSLPDIYLSFFMFTTNMKPDDLNYRKIVVAHIKELQKFGYSGFEFPIAPTYPENYATDLENYTNLRQYINEQGLSEVKISTNVGATPSCDPSSTYPEQQKQALEYLKSRVDITEALGGEIMMGPILIPYGSYPVKDFTNNTLWSDALQDELEHRYQNARPILNELGQYATEKKC